MTKITYSELNRIVGADVVSILR